MASDNAACIDAGFAKAKSIIYNHLINCLMSVCEQSVTYAMNHHSGFKNFTGNTHTGYACGLYNDGSLVFAAYSADKDKPPVRVKLTEGETAFLNPDYDGVSRRFTGEVKTDKGYGKDFAMKFLQSHKPKNKKGLSICLTSGTEYSLYLEVSRHADVLTGTFIQIPQILFNSLKPIP